MSYLTERQRQVLEFVRGRLRTTGVAPTLQEICDRFGFAAIGSAQKHVRLLEQKGYLRRIPHQKRGLVLLEDGGVAGSGGSDRPEEEPGTTELPLLGQVAAGAPIEAIPGDEAVTVPRTMIRTGPHFALRVRGDSMIDDGIHDGDLVVVQSRREAADGEAVIALVAGEVTLKRLYRQSEGLVRLEPANPAVAPIVADGREVTVQGVVVGLLRRY